MSAARWAWRLGPVTGVILVSIILYGWPGAPRPIEMPAEVQPPAEKMPVVEKDVMVRMDGAGAYGYVELPDGTFLPNLNGVKAKDKLHWSGGAFPRIRGVVRNPADGIEWYELANGDVFTTVQAPGTDAAGAPVRRDLILYVQRRDRVPVLPRKN